MEKFYKDLTLDLSKSKQEYFSLLEEVNNCQKEITRQQYLLDDSERNIIELKSQIKIHEDSSQQLTHKLPEQIVTCQQFEKKYFSVISSLSWRVVCSVVRLARRIPGASGFICWVKSFAHQWRIKKYKKIILESGLFHVDYYYALNPKLKESGLDPVIHFLLHGGFEGRRPNPTFDPEFYLQNYPEAALSGLNPLLHYILFGLGKGLKTQEGMPLPDVSVENQVRYTSGQTIIFVGHDGSQTGAAKVFLNLLQWVKTSTALDIRIVVLSGGVWRKKYEGIAPTLVLSDFSTLQPEDIAERVEDFAGNDIKAVYLNTVAGAPFLNFWRRKDVPLVVHIHEMQESLECLFPKEMALLQKNDVHFLAVSSMAQRVLRLLEEESLELQLGAQGYNNVSAEYTIEKAGIEVLHCLRGIAKLAPAVSVIVPNYNHAPYLEERLESIYKQDFKDIEVILLDDASTDQSRQILAEYNDLYPEITILLCNKENSGSVFKQWEKGTASARAKLLWIAESDDVSDERFLSLMLPQMSDSEVMLSYCQSYALGGVKREAKTYAELGYYDLLGRERWYHSYINTGIDEITRYFAVYNIIPNVSSTLIRNTGVNAVLDSCCQYKLSGDWAFYLSHIEGGKISYLAQPLNYHRGHPDSVIARNRNEILFREFEQVHYWVATRYNLSSSVKEMMARCLVDIVYAHYGKGLGKKLEDLYAIQKIQMAAPGVISLR